MVEKIEAWKAEDGSVHASKEGAVRSDIRAEVYEAVFREICRGEEPSNGMVAYYMKEAENIAKGVSAHADVIFIILNRHFGA